MPYKFKPGLVTVTQNGKAVKLDGLAVPSSSDVTEEYVDQQDAETLSSAKSYTDAELARAVEAQVAKDTQQDAEISGKQPKGDYATSTKLTQAVEAQAKKDAAQDNAISELSSSKADRAYVNQTFANALIGKVSGPVVAVDDVSPVEHSVGCRVERLNRVKFPYVSKTGSSNYGITYDVLPDGKIHMFGTATGTSSFILSSKYTDPNPFSVGKMYHIKSGQHVIINALVDGKSTYFENDFLWTENSVFKTAYLQKLSGSIDVIIEPMVSEIAGAPYTPYVPDLDKVTVTRTGKNLAKFGKNQTAANHTAVVQENQSEILVNGTEGTDFINFGSFGYLPAGKYTFSVEGLAYKNNLNKDRTWIAAGGSNYAVINHGEASFTLKAGAVCSIFCVLTATYTNSLIKIMLSKTGGKYEPYKPAMTLTPSPSGTVSGMTSLSPAMTILTDNPGVTINAEYNKDTNKVIGGLMDRIAALESSKTNIEEV